ncbi:uncharacterized protein EDB91DRAFT_368473 [Suillus paluster]|uniref:uncharacterized protein n=1 Tax=Suillus paluster TaxID=48578 RepID=UPI001B87312D|nr:uncharacterized protein EDB91DRAFT_368473 [Suillus paluster]KAG1739819.1 hypothetical protein EDB91DRAFT_368473 [Suillus paluster]
MATSSKSIEENWHLSNVLAHDALPNRQDDSESIIFDSKSTAETGTNFYDSSLTSRRYALVGVGCSTIVSCTSIAIGAIIVAKVGASGLAYTPVSTDKQREILALVLNLIVTLCTESIGFVHGISLRSALASESRLRFNTNLRLMTAARGWNNPNSVLLNCIMAVLLILSYSSSSLVVLQYVFYADQAGTTTSSSPLVFDSTSITIGTAGLPLLVLGITLLLQIVIALAGMRAAKILTWSSSPFNLTAALVHHTQLTPVPLQCMRGASDLDVGEGPTKPSQTQPSAWHAHPSVRKVIISLWVIVVIYVGSVALATYRSSFTWTFLPSAGSDYLSYTIRVSGGLGWVLAFASLASLQGWMTLGLHFAELIANVIRDERQWRRATGRKGLNTATNSFKLAFTDAFSLVLLVLKSALHWMFGLSFTVIGSNSGIKIFMFPAQFWNLCIALFIFICFVTLVALRRPRGPQPTTYGHLQTLANLVDEWSPVMWWGHKEDGIPYCHAGTSDHPLPDVKMDCVYCWPQRQVPSMSRDVLAFVKGVY